MASFINSFQISKDTVVRSIKNEIWKKKDPKPENSENHSENDIFALNPQDSESKIQIPDFKSDLVKSLKLKPQNPVIIFDLQSHHEIQKKVRKLRKEMEDLEQMEPDLKKNNKFRIGQLTINFCTF